MLPVHNISIILIEQSPESGFYFRVNDPEHLDEIMKDIWLNPVPKRVGQTEITNREY